MVTEVPGYVLRDPIGAGSTATVWRGEAVGTPGRVLAIKLVPHADGHTACDALRRRGEVLARLSHPNLLPVVAVVPTDDGLALVTPYAPGGSLAAMLAHAHGGLPAAEVADLGVRLASALTAVHRVGIVHRAIKPANVLFDRDRQPLLGDVGLVRFDGDGAAIADAAEYLDPGLLDGREPDARSDLYALGVMLYEALAGVPPYTGATVAQTVTAANLGRFVPLDAHVDAPSALTAAIEAAFARDVQDRPAGAHELAWHLDEIRRSMSGTEDDPPSHPASTGGRAGVLGAAVSPAGSVTFSPRRDTRPPSADGRSAIVSSRAVALAPRRDEPSRPRRVPRDLLVAAVVAVVLVPAVQMVASVSGDGAAETTPREPAPACTESTSPDDGREILLADVTARGCSTPVAWDGRQLEVLGDTGPTERYELGAEPEDVLLFGDWTCDGRDAPALYRPADGQLFTFDELVGAGDRTSATGAPTGVTEGSPTVVTDDAGCDRVEVAS
jgi:eukaryotic-like serine/threonine-protein kinase